MALSLTVTCDWDISMVCRVCGCRWNSVNAKQSIKMFIHKMAIIKHSHHPPCVPHLVIFYNLSRVLTGTVWTISTQWSETATRRMIQLDQWSAQLGHKPVALFNSQHAPSAITPQINIIFTCCQGLLSVEIHLFTKTSFSAPKNVK